MAKPKPLPKRFQPLANQAATETAIRYGGQETALASVLSQLTHDYSRQSQAQADAGQSVLGALHGAGDRLTRTYSDAGLTPALLAQIGNSPTGQRLAGELASGKADLQQQLLGAQAGQQYIQGHLGDQYREDVGKVNSQLTSEQQERGLYQSSLLDQLISGDRSARHDANLAAAKQQHADLQATLDRQSSLGNALIGQGLAPVLNKDGSVTVGSALPGGKADPNAPQNQAKKPKRTTGPGTASPQRQSDVATDFGQALGIAQQLTKGEKLSPALRQWVEQQILNGAPAIEGKPVYDTRTKVKGIPNPNYGKPLLDPKTGTAVTTQDGAPAIPQVKNQPAVQAALDMIFNGAITPKTLAVLHRLGYAVNGIPGAQTEHQRQQEQRRLRSRPGNASDGSGGSRPT